MLEVLQEQDIVKIISKKDDLGLYQIKGISGDVIDGWWHVILVLLNHPFEFTFILDNDHLHQFEFIMGGIPVRLELYARPNVLAPAKSSDTNEIISIF